MDKLIDEIIKLINNNYQLDKQYINRRNNQLCFLNDENNSERCFEAIMKVSTSRSSKKISKENKKVQTSHFLSEKKVINEFNGFTGLSEEY